MTGAEMIGRSRQEVSKRADALLARIGYEPWRISPKEVESGRRNAADPPPRFFFESRSVAGLAAELRQRLPRQAEKIHSDAEEILQHSVDLLGYESVDVGNPIDWHCDAVHGKRSPRKLFYKIRYLNFDECGDSKIVWELNRHQHWMTLARAYLLTGDRRYAEEIFLQWDHWHAENPYPFGINWASSLEVAFRSLAWIWVFHLLEESDGMPAGFRQRWLQSLVRNGRHIERYLSTYFSANTHLLGEAVALFFLGVLCPELPQARRWKEKGWRIILQESERQILGDGFHFEQSVYYHVYAVDFFLHSLILARKNAVEVPPEFEKRVEKMLDALFQLGQAGTLPGFGDDDGGRLFDPRRNRGEHLLDPLATGAILFGRSDFKALAGELREESLWLLAEQGVAEWGGMDEKPLPTLRSAALAGAGYYVLTTNDPPCAMIVDAGPQGAQNAGHGHADALSLTLQSGGRALLIDPGTYKYVGDGGERDRFRGTARHNTVSVDGMSQSEPAGPFAWKNLVRGKGERWIAGESFDLFVGSHDGYQRIEESIVHRRWVVALKPGLFFVSDMVLGRGRHRIELSWHLGTGLRECGIGEFRGAGDEGVAILNCEDRDGTRTSGMEDWSPAYGRKEQAPVVRYARQGELPFEHATLLVPLPNSASAWRLNRIGAVGEDSPAQAYRLTTPNEECELFLAGAGREWRCEGIGSDGRFVCRRRARNGSTLIVCDGSYLEIDGKRVLDCATPVERCEVFIQGGAARISCSDVGAVRSRPEQIADSLQAHDRE